MESRMNKIEPDDVNVIFGMPPKGFDCEVVALDTEWFGQDVNRLHRPHGRFGCLTATGNGQDVYIIFKDDEIQEFMNRVGPNAVQVYHNAQYDIRQLRKYATIHDTENLWDTMLVEQVRFSGYYNKFGLNDLARRYLGIYMEKGVREEFSDDSNQEMSDEQIFYACVDAVCTWHVAKAQMDQIDSDDRNIWENVERPFLWVLLSSKGVYFNTEKWMERANAAKAKAEELDKSMPFNPRSSKQVKEYMLSKYKIKLESSDEEHLQTALNKNPDIIEIETILESRGLTKDASTYGEKWALAVEEDGRLYPSYRQILETGRVSAGGDVAIQTTPHKDEYRSCIMAAPGNIISVRDYSAQEPRILAYITQDKKMIDTFRKGKDIYISIGYEIFGEVFDKKDPRRQQMKSIILGISYGMSIFGLAAKMGVDEETATEWLDIFFKKFAQAKKWVDSCQVWKPYTTTILGRKFWGNPYSNGWQRNYQNFPMQGSAADCTKIAAACVYSRLGYNPFLIYMHDELVAEFTKEQFAEGDAVMNSCMLEVQEWMHEGIPGSLEAFAGADWSVKK